MMPAFPKIQLFDRVMARKEKEISDEGEMCDNICHINFDILAH